MIRAFILAGIACGSLAGCASTSPVGSRGEAAYQIFPPAAQTAAPAQYAIGPYDVISITTYQEEDLSFEELRVDASGNIPFPLIGTVQASGRTAAELSEHLAARLGERYLVNPQVTVVVNASSSQKVTIDGEVKNAGVFPIEGETTLLGALALAKGTTDVASRDDVVIFRTIDGQRMAGIFDLTAIRRGLAEDPQILANDIVVVGFSSGRQLYRDVLAASPLIAGIFRPIAGNGGNNN